MIEIALEDVQVEREQKEYLPMLGRCDICRSHDAVWTVKFNWVRNKFYIVPSLAAYAFLCEDCHTNMDATREVLRQHLQQQANYRLEQVRRSIVEAFNITPQELGVPDAKIRHQDVRHQESSVAGGSNPSIRDEPPTD